MMYGPEPTKPGECGARLWIGDDYGDNSATMVCRLPEGHEGWHEETWGQEGERKLIRWEKDQRKRCQHCGKWEHECDSDGSTGCPRYSYTHHFMTCPVCIKEHDLHPTPEDYAEAEAEREHWQEWDERHALTERVDAILAVEESAMTDEQVGVVLALYERTLTEKGYKPIQADLAVSHQATDVRLNHCLWAVGQVREFLKDGRREKAMRWLGFLQGALWSEGLFSISSLADHNRPPPT
jgi:hypothetical protein